MKTKSVRRRPRQAAAALALGMFVATLTGCGQVGPVKLGAAATLGGHRITTAQVESGAKEWRATAYKAGLTDEDLRSAAPQLSRTMLDPGSPERSVLYRLIDFAVVERLARTQRIDVTPGQIDEAVSQQGGRQRIEVEAFRYGVPPSQGRALIARDLRLGEIVRRTGITDQQQAVDKIKQMLGATVRTMKVSVNPRFGSFDYREFLLTPACTALSKGTWQQEAPRGGAAAPAAPSPDRPRPGCYLVTQPAGELP